MAKVKTVSSSKGQKITFCAGRKKPMKFGSMNKQTRRNYKKYRGQGRV